MLKITEIKRSDIPQFVWDNFTTDVILKFTTFYKSEGMFGVKSDYLLIFEISEPYQNGIPCYGYVYNGNASDCSEFGNFGLNEQKTERIW